MNHRFGHRHVTGLGLLATDLATATGRASLLTRAGALAIAAERAGFDSFWVEDHLRGAGPVTDAGGVDFEAYSLLGALATLTRTVRLGCLPSGADPRAPASLAKIVTGVDVISNGRSVVTLASGTAEDPDAVDRLAEGLQVCRSVLDDQYPGFAGRHFTIAGAVNQPPPVQPGGVPLVVALRTAERSWPKSLAVALTFADAVVVDGGARSVAIAAKAALAKGSATEVVWTGTVPGPIEGARAIVAEVAAAGATGCILEIPGAEGAGRLGELVPDLVDALEPASSRR